MNGDVFKGRILARRHRLVDLMFTLPPIDPPERLERIFSLARNSYVELEAHPVLREEYEFLTNGELLRRAGDTAIAVGFALPRPVSA